jgi:hypothetical protein
MELCRTPQDADVAAPRARDRWCWAADGGALRHSIPRSVNHRDSSAITISFNLAPGVSLGTAVMPW